VAVTRYTRLLPFNTYFVYGAIHSTCCRQRRRPIKIIYVTLISYIYYTHNILYTDIYIPTRVHPARKLMDLWSSSVSVRSRRRRRGRIACICSVFLLLTIIMYNNITRERKRKKRKNTRKKKKMKKKTQSMPPFWCFIFIFFHSKQNTIHLCAR